ncbi:MAG: DNA polymerase III subunit alpha, partial [Simkaniaceae bacterium]|nr:DNA polymerase III subunit alpha [Simkaniaceae bacterium]
AAREQKEKSKGVLDLFASVNNEETKDLKPPETTLVLSKQSMLKREKELLGFYLTGHPMEEFGDLIKKLGCTAFELFASLDHQSVCKVVFIIESVRIRITSKSQRKFAILVISDGIQRFELPVWPSMYEEKSHLFNENQLLYGVVQIEKEDEEVKLRARYLEDLALTEEENLKECDEAFTLAKKQAKSDKMREKKMVKEANQVSFEDQRREKEQLVKLLISVDIEKINLSHILYLKKVFYKFSGNTAVHIEFIAENQPVGSMHIQSEWGIRLDQEFEGLLRGLPFMIKHQLIDNKGSIN